MPTRNLRDGELVIKDGAGAPKSVTVALDDGALRWVETNNIVNVSDRGSLSHMRAGPRAPIVGEFSIRFQEFFTLASGGDPSPYEALTQRGDGASWTSTNTDNGEVYTLKLEFTIADPESGGSDETVAFARVCPTRIGFKQGDKYDTLTVAFQDFETAPTIT